MTTEFHNRSVVDSTRYETQVFHGPWEPKRTVFGVIKKECLSYPWQADLKVQHQ